MKKITKLLSLALGVLFASMFLTACGGNHELVGTWIWENDSNWIYTFNDDGTGVRGGGALNPISEFEWTIYETEDGDEELHIECPIAMFAVYSERWSYTVDDDVLILDSLQQGGQGLRYVRE